MTEAAKKRRSGWILFFLIVVCVGPFLIALFLYMNRSGWIGAKPHGTLIDPAMPVDRSEFVGFDQFSRENLAEIRGRWILIHFITHHGCGSACRKSLEKTRQVRLMLSKDLMRVRRVAVVMAEVTERDANEWWQEHPDLIRTVSTSELERVAASAAGDPIPDGVVMIMDPLGNLMMWYPPGFDPYGLKKDLQRLLLVSQIG